MNRLYQPFPFMGGLWWFMALFEPHYLYQPALLILVATGCCQDGQAPVLSLPSQRDGRPAKPRVVSQEMIYKWLNNPAI